MDLPEKYKGWALILFVSGVLFAQPGLTNPSNMEMVIQNGHSMPVHTICFSPDGKLILSAAYNSDRICLYTRDGKLIRNFKGFCGPLAFHPYGDRFVFIRPDKHLIIMDLFGQELTNMPLDIRQPGYLAVSSRGQIALTDYSNKKKLILVSEDGRSRNLDTGDQYLKSSPVFSPDGQYIAVGTGGSKALIWNRKGRLIRTISAHTRPHPVWALAFSPDGRILATAAPEERVALWSLPSGKKIRDLGSLKGRKRPWWDNVTSIDFSPDSKILVSGTENGLIRLWNIDGTFIRVLAEHSSQMVRFSPDGTRIITDGPDNAFYAYDRKGNLLNKFKGVENFCGRIEPLSNHRILTASYHDGIRIWGADGRLEARFGKDSRYLTSLAVGPKEHWIAATPPQKGKILIWDTKGNKKGVIRLENKDEIRALAFYPDGKCIASMGEDKRVNVWTLSGKHLLRSEKIDGGSTLSFSADGQRLVVSGKNRTTINLKTKQMKIRPLTTTTILAFSPDGNRYLTAGSDETEFLLWNIDGTREQSFFAPRITAVCFSPDGRWIASGGYDETIRVWDIRGPLVKTLTGHQDFITDLAFSKDGHTLISGAMDVSMRLWNTRTWDPVVFTVRGDEWVMFSPDGYFDGSRNSGSMVAMVRGNTAYAVDQFAAHRNRPDILLNRLGTTTTQTLDYYESLYKKRLKRMGLSAETDPGTAHIPTATVTCQQIHGNTATVDFSLSDPQTDLHHYHVYVNDIPLYGAEGRALHGQSYKGKETVTLTTGTNKIEVSCVNANGAESYRAVSFAEYTRPLRGDLYFIGFGVSDYADPSLNLGYAAKDVQDLATLFSSMQGKGYDKVHVKTVLDRAVTPKAIRSARFFLDHSRPRDTLVLFIAGHGMYSPGRDPVYYYLTAQTDLDNLAQTAAPFTDVESILQGVPPRNKLFLMDTCQSGEIDPMERQAALALSGSRGVKARAPRGLKVKTITRSARPWLRERNRYIHNDLIRRSGAIVFSSSRGNEFSYENARYENGLFTEGILKCLAARSKAVSTETLRKDVASFVSKESGGHQNPVVDRDNIYQIFSFPAL